jgi:hypothetical protein
MSNQSVFLRCTIEKGAFSGERIFKLDTPNGGNYVGVAPTDYCKFESHEILQNGSLSQINGKLEARLIERSNGKSIVSIPNGEVIYVVSSCIIE